jgi:hypothetical protein
MNNETIRWLMADSVKPDDAETVLVNLTEPDGDPVCAAWYDTANSEWRCAISNVLLRQSVSYWTPMPRGPM